LLLHGLRLLGLILLGFLLVLYVIQDRMIFPGSASQGTAEVQVSPRAGSELVTLSSPRGERITALYGPALDPDGRPMPDAALRPALVYFYGNAMCLVDTELEFESFRRLGLNVLIPDYLGYGMSAGRASEKGCRETAEACYEWLRQRGFPPSRILSGGWSLGGAVAIDLASRHSVGGLFAFCTFTSTRDMALSLCRLPLPRWFFVHQFDNLEKIARIDCPILLGHDRRDEIVPFAMFERLSAAAKGPLSTLTLDRAGHNDFYRRSLGFIKDAISKLVTSLPR
jgi:fermentation-respiration switch protein FrsA (DUF1100 family)